MAENKEENKENKKKFKCDECGEEFKSEKGLRVHQSKAHGTSSISISNPWKAVSLISVVLLVLSLGYTFTQSCPEGGVTGHLTSSEAGEEAASYIRELPQMQLQGVNVSMTNVTDTESGVYKVGILLSSPQGNQELQTYVTKDGKFLFPQGIDTTQTQQNTQDQTQEQNNQQAEQENIPKSEKPKVELFLMSFCPYGNEAENTMESVYELLGDTVQWEPHYIVSERNGEMTSLHGEPEVEQNKRELCVLEDHGIGKWFDFTTYVNNNCGSDGKCWEDAADEIGVNPEKISTCVEERGTEMLKEEAQISQEKGATGSPTLLINGQKSNVVYQYGNSEAYKSTICSAFETEPDLCSETLGSSSSSSTGGSC
ncbi:MAG: DsbA family protein [Candidatus Aenigmatarchaeota archaeon]